MPGFLIRVWCRDCCDEDPAGCFGGGSELRGPNGADPLGPDRQPPDTFATRELADAYGCTFTDGPPWDFEVCDETGKAIAAAAT